MAFHGLRTFIDLLDKEGELIRIREFVDPELEITEVTDRISKLSDGGKALLFENTGTQFPLLINAMGSEKRMALALGRDNLESIEKEITGLFHQLTSPKDNLWEKLKMLPQLNEFASLMPKKLKGRGKCQEVIMNPSDLGLLPVLKCWPADGGRFITLPAVHTTDPETGAPNVGMYRMQVFQKNLTGMHWQMHKTGAVHFTKYKNLGRKMQVTVTLGGDPAYIYSATAPMPENMDEYLLAGFLRKKQVHLVKCLTNELFVPEDVDFVIEGFIDPAENLIREGPFGDHTGFYSLADYYPGFHVNCITHRQDAIYPATIVGIPPMEDAWIGKATERIFITPLRLMIIPELVDMDLPFAGVAHNVSVVKIRKSYPGQAVKVMNSLWGAGQMMFNKILIVVDDHVQNQDYNPLSEHGAEGTEQGVKQAAVSSKQDAVSSRQTSTEHHKSQITNQQSQINNQRTASCEQPAAFIDIHDYAVLSKIFSENFDTDYSLLFSKGPLDILDHSSHKFAYGSKLGIDLTHPFPEEIQHKSKKIIIPDSGDIIRLSLSFLTGTKSLLQELSLPVLLLTVDKNEKFSRQELIKELSKTQGIGNYKVVLIFNAGAPLDDLFTLVWLLGGNLEPSRDISILQTSDGRKVVFVDATIKTPEHDHFQRDWPNIVTMDERTITAIDNKWSSLGLGKPINSPSLKYKPLVKGTGAVREL